MINLDATIEKQTFIQKFSRKTIVGFVLFVAALLFTGGMYIVSALQPTAPVLSGQAGNEQVTLEWTEADTGDEATIAWYAIEYSVSGAEDWQPHGESYDTTAVVGGLTNGTAYDFRVYAVDSDQDASEYSNVVTLTPFTVPDAPTDVSAERGNEEAVVSFAPPAFDGGSEIIEYKVIASPGNITQTGDSSPITVGGLTNGTAYTFTVVAINEAGESVASSPSNEVTPATVPDAPTDVEAVRGNGQATITFTPPASDGGSAITSYTVTSSPEGITGTGNGSPIIVTGLTNGTPYTFTVTATNEVGTSAPSDVSDAIIPATTPDAPTALTATPGNGEVVLEWTAPEETGGLDVTDYVIEYSEANQDDWTVFADGASTNSTATVTGLTNGVEYDFRVSAVNEVGQGVASVVATSTPYTIPDAPTIGVITPGNGQVSVAFASPDFNGGSEIIEYTVTSNPGGFTGTGNSSPIIVEGLTNGTAYTFTITATNIAGTSAPSEASASVTPRTVPGAPTGVSAVRGNGEATITFTPPASDGGSAITNYTVTSSPGGFTASGVGSPITVTGLANGTSYTFTVVATNDAGDGPASAASSAVTPATTPDAPTGLSATPSNGQVELSWTAPASNGGVAITDYVVEWSESGENDWTIFADGTSSSTNATVTGLVNGVAYDFRVSAVNEVGQGVASVVASSTPRTTPGAPTNVSATPGNGQATVTFTAPASTGGSAITGYTVTSNPGGITASGASSPIVVTGLTNGTAYTFTVVATNAAGDSEASAASDSVTPYTVPGAPTGVTATPGNGSASVSFTPPVSNGGSAITSYTVTSSPGGFTGSGANSPITVTGLTNGEEYTFTVVATNAAGDSVASAVSAGVTPAAVPDEPTDLVATPGNGQVALSWAAPADNGSEIIDYVVEWSIGGQNNWTIFADGTSTDTAAVVTGLTNGTAYDFRVSAVNAAGQGIASELATATPHTVPGVPTALTVTVGNKQIGLIWAAPASNGGSPITDYVVEYSLSDEDDWTIFSDGTSTTPSAVVTDLENGVAYDFRVTAVNAAGLGVSSAIVTATPVLPTTVISKIVVEPTDTSAVISWETDLGASSQVEYGPSSSFGSLTPVTDEDDYPTIHSVTIEDLNPCTTYVFRVMSQPEDGGVTTSAERSFTTTGCVGESEVVDERIETVSMAGGSVTLDNGTPGSTSLSLTFPAGSTEGDVVVQIKRLDSLAVAVTGKPQSALLVSNGQVYDIKAIAEDGTLVTDFNQPVSITIKYGDGDIKDLDEPTLKLYNWHDGTWNVLSDCVVDTANNTITCATTQFSLFALFGLAAQTQTPPTDTDTSTQTPGNSNVTPTGTGDGQVEEDTTADTTTDQDTDSQPTPGTTGSEDDQDDVQSEKGSMTWWIIAAIAGVITLIIIIAISRRSREG